jgi:pyrimidine-nucleoside phosphorylase
MRAVDVIVKKRDGQELSQDEIDFFIQGFAQDEIPDYQAAAWAMAVLLKGMSAQETTYLTQAMADSGDQLDLSDVVPVAVDKHSTGGVGDKTTLVVEPLVAACDVPVGKMSGRGLSFTGGTLDKMEAIPGFRIDLTMDEFRKQLGEIGLVLSGQTADLAPADGKMYALRDVTGTVPSIPLIASSVMSKKIAAGAQAIVLDVKVGVGAFMQTVEQAEILAKAMVEIGTLANRKVVGLISDMNQPLGQAVGNSLEVVEAIQTLKGNGPADFKEHCLVVAAHMVLLAGKAVDLEDARAKVENALENGTALAKFVALVQAQGGDTSVIDQPETFPLADFYEVIHAPQSGWIKQIHAREVGLAAVSLGAGRERKGDPIDHSVGIVVYQNVGDRVSAGDPLFAIYARDQVGLDQARKRVLEAHAFSESEVQALPLFYKTIYP